MNTFSSNATSWDLHAQPNLIYQAEQPKRRQFYDFATEMQLFYSCGHSAGVSAYIGVLNALILVLDKVSLVEGVLDYCRRKNPSEFGTGEDDQSELKESLIRLRNQLRAVKQADAAARTEQVVNRCGHPELTWGRFSPDSALRLLQMISKYGVEESVLRTFNETTTKKGMIGFIRRAWSDPVEIILKDKTPESVWTEATFFVEELFYEFQREKEKKWSWSDQSGSRSANLHSDEEISADRELRKKMIVTRNIDFARNTVTTMAESFRKAQADYFVRREFPTEKAFWQNRHELYSQISMFDRQNRHFVECCAAAISSFADQVNNLLLAGLHWYLVTNDLRFDSDFDVWRKVSAEKIIEYFRAYNSPDSEFDLPAGGMSLIGVDKVWSELCDRLFQGLEIYNEFKALNPDFMEIKLTGADH